MMMRYSGNVVRLNYGICCLSLMWSIDSWNGIVTITNHTMHRRCSNGYKNILINLPQKFPEIHRLLAARQSIPESHIAPKQCIRELFLYLRLNFTLNSTRCFCAVLCVSSIDRQSEQIKKASLIGNTEIFVPGVLTVTVVPVQLNESLSRALEPTLISSGATSLTSSQSNSARSSASVARRRTAIYSVLPDWALNRLPKALARK